MSTKLLPGAARKLRSLGYNPASIGRIYNKAALLPVPEGVPVASNSAEVAEMLLDPAKAHKILATRESLIGWTQAYGEKVQGEGTELHETLRNELQRDLRNMLIENGQKGDTDSIRRLNLDPQTRPTAMITGKRQGTAHNIRAAGAILDKEFSSFEQFLQETWHNNRNPEVQAKLSRLANASSSVVPADGGFLVPEAFRSQLLQLALEESVVRPRATVVPMEVPRVAFPMIDSTTNSGSVFGGMIAYWTEESGTFTDSSPKFGRITLDAKKLTGYAVVPNELLRDSYTSFTGLLETMWPKAIAFFEDVAFMTGTGVGEPKGFLGAQNDAAIEVAKETGQTAGTIYLENIINMYARMLPASLNRAVWIVSPETIPQLFTMSLSVGTGGAPVMLVNAAGPGPSTMLGRPIIISEKAGQVGTRGDISLVDLSYYLIGDRQEMSTAQSEHTRFSTDETAFRILQRVDGKPWLQSAMTPQNGGDTLSAFVELAARA